MALQGVSESFRSVEFVCFREFSEGSRGITRTLSGYPRKFPKILGVISMCFTSVTGGLKRFQRHFGEW